MTKKRADAARTQQQMEEALAARDEIEEVLESAKEKVSLMQGLKAGWAKVHERNNLARLFEQEWRATH